MEKAGKVDIEIEESEEEQIKPEEATRNYSEDTQKEGESSVNLQKKGLKKFKDNTKKHTTTGGMVNATRQKKVM